MQPTAHQ